MVRKHNEIFYINKKWINKKKMRENSFNVLFFSLRFFFLVFIFYTVTMRLCIILFYRIFCFSIRKSIKNSILKSIQRKIIHWWNKFILPSFMFVLKKCGFFFFFHSIHLFSFFFFFFIFHCKFILRVNDKRDIFTARFLSAHPHVDDNLYFVDI